jgi:hypothetical protein
MTVHCDCTGKAPWPAMLKLSVAGQGRFYLCRECGAVREEVCRVDGTVIEIHYHDSADAADLSPVVLEQVRAILDAPEFEQLALF